MTIKMTIYEH